MKKKSVASSALLIITLTHCFFYQGCEIFKYISGSQQAASSNGLTDIANMFNERSYYKSNTFSLDEQEIINDFNGNLMYTIPLYNYALSGDLNFNLSLNYNGSVGHQIIVGNLNTYISGTYERFNMNSPEWIINLNGIAVQTLNFETGFVTNKVLNNEIKVNRVNSIILPRDYTPDSSTYTIKYNYDNVNNYIYILSFRNTLTNEYSKIKYSLDGFANVKGKDVFTSNTDSNRFVYQFNFMNKAARNFDALNDSTMFSYDGLERNIKTTNADLSSTSTGYLYFSSLNNYFGSTYTGFVERQYYTDEQYHNFEKYFDAVGNLLQEIKYAYEVPEDAATFNMITNYQYDSLYRLIKVQTPGGKIISYSYDGYGRQSQRITPDAGQTNYIYNSNNDLIYSQDANQRSANPDLYTFRNYDGIKRLTGTGDALVRQIRNDIDQNQSESPVNYLTVNVYDTLSSSIVSDLFSPPPDYYTTNNFTKGNLVATAYRTRNTDNWSFKYYRYDTRGRVIKMWNILDGLPEKIVSYEYNSQDQVTKTYYGEGSEYKRYRYSYDFAGRLSAADFYAGEHSTDVPEAYRNFTNYTYNANSLLEYQHFNSYLIENSYQYNNRNWIISLDNHLGQFSFANTYFKNGNLQTQLLHGTYRDYMQNRYNLHYNYSYDNSNRLLSAVNTNQGDNTYSVYNTYDNDGNIITLKRYGDNNTVTDDFHYQYLPNTNKVRLVSGASDQYNYDLNGNTVFDDVNSNFNFKYDYRNLITELYHKATEGRAYIYATRYYYDESGNRVRKLTYVNTQTDPPSIIDWNNPGNGWQLFDNEFYVKGVDGKDLAIYKGNVLDEWFVWASDLVGKIKENKQYYYYKDHLGSVRVVVDNTGAIVAGYDYDAWGYPLENRNYNGDSIKFKYTSKELDKESFYDYFGARYYDARIGRWGQVEPLLDKYPSLTPYNYSVDNPLRVIDPNGADPFEIIVRTYIPFDVVFPGFKGDSRGADPNATSYRTEQRITVETDRSISSKIIQNYNTSLSPSMSINPMGTNPPYLVGMGEGEFSAIASYSSDVNEGNNATIEFIGEAHVGIIPTALSPAINYTFGITILPQKDGTVQVLISGEHDRFPAYEIYIKDKSGNTTPIYNQSPVDPIMGPLDLIPGWNTSQKINSEFIIP